jgi:hypothetical protein
VKFKNNLFESLGIYACVYEATPKFYIFWHHDTDWYGEYVILRLEKNEGPLLFWKENEASYLTFFDNWAHLPFEKIRSSSISNLSVVVPFQ